MPEETTAIGVHPFKATTASIDEGKPIVELGIAGRPIDSPGAPASLPAHALFSLKGQGIIITGGARGLGLCLAIAILEASASHVYCLDILPEPDAVEWKNAQAAADQYGGRIEYRQLDITADEDVTRVFGEIFESCEVPVQGFFGAAGIQQMVKAVDYTGKDFRRIMEVNVTGTFLTVQAAAKEMLNRGIRGSIVMTASMSGSVTNQGLTCLAYNTSKAALLQMARSAAAEWGPHGVRVNTLSPGYIRTAMTDALLAERPDLEKQWLSGSMLDRLSTPDEFRGPVLFLLSKASSFMTGADLIIDGSIGYLATLTPAQSAPWRLKAN